MEHSFFHLLYRKMWFNARFSGHCRFLLGSKSHHERIIPRNAGWYEIRTVHLRCCAHRLAISIRDNDITSQRIDLLGEMNRDHCRCLGEHGIGCWVRTHILSMCWMSQDNARNKKQNGKTAEKP